jgi:hypothetical protein
MSKIKIIIALAGSILVIFGVLGPWISFYGYSEFYNGTEKINLRINATISPFTLSFTFYTLPNNALFIKDGYNFYDPLALLIGLFCILGSILGFLGTNLINRKYAFIGITLIILSTLSFFLCIPKNISVLRFYLMPRWYITIFGGIVIIISNISTVMKIIYSLIRHPF